MNMTPASGSNLESFALDGLSCRNSYKSSAQKQAMMGLGDCL